MLAAGVFIESTLCSEVAFLFSSSFDIRWKRGLLDGFLVLLALFGGRLPQLEISAYHATGEGQHQVVASRWFQRGVGSKILP